MALENTIVTYTAAGSKAGVIVQDHKALVNGNNVVVAAEAGKQIQVVEVIVCTETAGIFNITSGGESVLKLCMANNSNFTEKTSNPELPVFCGEVGQSLVINVSTSPANASIYIQYRRR